MPVYLAQRPLLISDDANWQGFNHPLFQIKKLPPVVKLLVIPGLP